MRLIILPLFCLVLSTCSLHWGTSQVCEPQGTALVQPDGGLAVYHSVDTAPDDLADGWPVSTLYAEGIDPAPVREMLNAVEDGAYTKLDSILIARNGKLVLEAYFNGFSRDTRHDQQSVSKTIGSMLVGVAIDKGLIAHVDVPVSRFFPDYWAEIEVDRELKDRITLAHLLTMTPGFDAESNWGIGPSRVRAMRRSDDWVEYALNLPMAYEPGTQFSYNSPTSVLVGGIIDVAVGEPAHAFAKRHLFAPLGITDYCWSMTRNGRTTMNSGFFLRPRDMLKLGQLYLDGGVRNGRRVISEGWVADSIRPHVDSARPDPERTEPSNKAYGYNWWMRWPPEGIDHKLSWYLATGNGGQKIFVFRNIDTVIVFTGSHYGEAIGHRQPVDILNRYILPALRD